jgi:hypothetical protein
MGFSSAELPQAIKSAASLGLYEDNKDKGSGKPNFYTIGLNRVLSVTKDENEKYMLRYAFINQFEKSGLDPTSPKIAGITNEVIEAYEQKEIPELFSSFEKSNYQKFPTIQENRDNKEMIKVGLNPENPDHQALYRQAQNNKSVRSGEVSVAKYFDNVQKMLGSKYPQVIKNYDWDVVWGAWGRLYAKAAENGYVNEDGSVMEKVLDENILLAVAQEMAKERGLTPPEGVIYGNFSYPPW